VRWNRVLCSSVLSGSALAAACSSGQLGRGEAARVLSASDSVTRSVLVPVEQQITGRACADTRPNASPPFLVLEQEGAVRLVENAEQGCLVELTDKGRTMLGAEHWKVQQRPQFLGRTLAWWTVPAGRVEVAHVDGVLQSDADRTQAQVDFTWRDVFDRRGEAVAKRLPKFVPDSGTARAEMRRFDDGWRVVNVAWHRTP
jgi:hypothetical protein